MPTYTHNFEFQLMDETINGEVTFDHGQTSAVHFYDSIEMSNIELHEFHTVLEQLTELYKVCGGFIKFEVTSK